MHTQGPWRIGKAGGVVADVNDSQLCNGADDVAFYGGYLVCESVSKDNAKLIAEAPAMFDLLSRISRYGDAGKHDEIAALIERVMK